MRTDYLKALHEAMDKLERAEASQKILQQLLNNLRGLTTGLEGVTKQLEKHLSVKPAQTSPAASPARKRRKTRKKRLPRLSPEQKRERAEVAKLRARAHVVVLRVAKARNVSPATVYAELTNKYGHKAKEAGKQELLDRIKFLSSKKR